MSILAHGSNDEIHLFARWFNAMGDIYIDVDKVTDQTVEITLSDDEGRSSKIYKVGDTIYLTDGRWTLSSITPDDENRLAWDLSRPVNVVLMRQL